MGRGPRRRLQPEPPAPPQPPPPPPGGLAAMSLSFWSYVVGGLLFLWLLFFAVAMYMQERKSMRYVHLPRLFLFVYMWMIGSFIGSLLCLPEMVFNPSKVRYKAHYYSGYLATLMYRACIGYPELKGLEHLPAEDEAVVYVANHNSSIDIALLYFIGVGRRFAWVSKSSVFMVPGVGQIMRLAKYVALTRGSKDSVKQMFDECKESIDAGWPVAIFPQGTRRRHKILPFKDGAFKLAIDNGIKLIPVTLYIPEDAWGRSKEAGRLVMHKPYGPGDKEFGSVEALKTAAFRDIISDLPYAKQMLAEQEATGTVQTELPSLDSKKKK